MKNKQIHLIWIGIVILFALPLSVVDKVEINWGKLVTEYYKFLINIFIISLVSLYFKGYIDEVIEGLRLKKKHESLLTRLNNLVIILDDKPLNLKELKHEWRMIGELLEQRVRGNIKFLKFQNFISNITENNIALKTKVPEFRELKLYIINLIKQLEDE